MHVLALSGSDASARGIGSGLKMMLGKWLQIAVVFGTACRMRHL
jgi:hypothetical protein